MAGQFDQYGAWAPIGAERTASGYEVAWKVTGRSGTSAALQSLEASFQQDLNGAGSIGSPVSGGFGLIYQGADGNGVQ